MTHYHYAPISGAISIVIDGVHQKNSGYEEENAVMEEFLRLRAAGEIKLIETIQHGHPHFNGHAGRVDVYGGAA